MKMPPETIGVLMSCLVPSWTRGNDFGLSEKDFTDYKSVIDDRLTELSRRICSWITSQQSTLDDEIDILSNVMVLCGQHSSPSLWTTEVSLLLTNDIFLSISSSYENSRSQPICQDVRIVKKVLSLLRPMLLAPTFRCNPAATTCYGWLLKKMEYSILSEFLQESLPTALILADDYEPLNIKLGLESLHHIIENIATEKLKWYGHDDVILDVLKKCLYLREPDIVSSHMKCFISLMSSSLRHDTSLKRSSFDEIINNVLVNMFMEQKLDLRRIYAYNMPDLIEARGLGIVRHLTIIYKILSEYALESSTTSHSLKALAKTVQVCWSRGDTVGENVLVILMKVLIIASKTPSHISYTKVSSDVHELAVILNEAFPTVVKHFLDNLRERSSFDQNLLALVRDVFKLLI